MSIRKGNRCLVTGGAGFIGSAFIRYGLQQVPFCQQIVNLDALTYAGDLKHVASVSCDPRYRFVQGDIADEVLVESLCRDFALDTIVHFAAESHVDRSIEGPGVFYKTNVEGTLHLLEVVRKNPHIHFHHVSTDEVYGSLGKEGMFSESSPYKPNSPYAASKAASDHFVRAYAHTYGLSATLSHCSNNFGPCQHREKLIPRMIYHALFESYLPIYGAGENIRDWLYVDDHVEAIWMIVSQGERGETYDIGAGCEWKNIDLVRKILGLLAEQTSVSLETFMQKIAFVEDRPGHDLRYAIDPAKIHSRLGWRPRHTLEEGLRQTIAWNLKNIYKDEICPALSV